jgi:hypothetical protein
VTSDNVTVNDKSMRILAAKLKEEQITFVTKEQRSQ